MNSIIAVKTNSNMELKAKQMILWFQEQKGLDLIKDVHALETFTENIDLNEDEVSSHLTEDDIKRDGIKKELASQITNIKSQLDVADNEEDKRKLRSEITRLDKRKKELTSKKIDSVVKGYVLVELKEGLEWLDNTLYALIQNVPVVKYVLSQLPIMQEELDYFFNVIEEELEPQAELEVVSEPMTIIEKVKEFAREKSEQVVNRFYIVHQKGKKNIIQLPLKIYKKIQGSIQKESIIYGRQGL